MPAASPGTHRRRGFPPGGGGASVPVKKTRPEERLARSMMRLAGAVAAGLAVAVPAWADDARIAVVVRDFDNPYWRALRDGAADEGRKLGLKVVVQAGATETDTVGENARIATLSNQDFTCFAVVPVNGSNVIRPLIPVSRKGIAILNLDTGLDQQAVDDAGLRITGFIGSDNAEAGRLAGRHLLAVANGHGKIAILEGTPGEHNGIVREKAFRAVAAGKFNIVSAQTGNFERARGLSITESLLRLHPDLVGIFAANDEMGLGAAQAIADAGRGGRIKVVSIDGVHEALDSVKSGVLNGTVSQYPYAEGQMAVQACQALAQKRPIAAHMTSPIALITSGNVDRALGATPRPFESFADPFGTP